MATLQQLQESIDTQQQKVDGFREALEVLKEKPKYEPQGLEPLDILRSMLANIESEEDRKETMRLAEMALEKAQSELDVLKAELQLRQNETNENLAHVLNAAREFNQLAEQLATAARKLLDTDKEARSILNAAYGVGRGAGVVNPSDLVIPSLKVTDRSVRVEVKAMHQIPVGSYFSQG